MNKYAYPLFFILLLSLLTARLWANNPAQTDHFPLVTAQGVADIYVDEQDYAVVEIAADMLADDIERVTGKRCHVQHGVNMRACDRGLSIVAGTVGHSRLIDELVERQLISVEGIRGQWEASITAIVKHPNTGKLLLVIAGSDRRGTAFGLTSLCRAIGVSPWYWWADVTPKHEDELYVPVEICQQQKPSVQYRGIFINDERFGGWAQWVEKTFDTETHQVGPKVYKRVFELLLRLRANYLWPAMHPGTQAFNADAENARLADDYAIVMGSSHCEQMLRNNEGEWKAVGTYGDFNYITNRQTMQDYWEERVRTNGKYENTYTLGLRGIHDYPMEGANTTEQRVALMQQAIDDQRDMLQRNIDRPLDEIPQMLCTYEEVLDAYHNGLQVPEDVTLLWSDDKQGYTRNLCNPEEMKRKGGAGIYYHLSYHGDPASWIWLSPLSPSFISTELTKAYTYGAQKVWIFNVGDIKPAEKEISFAMDLAWDVERWKPQSAHDYIRHWAVETFGEAFADEIASMQATYYRLMAAGKDSHVWFVEYSEQEMLVRMAQYRDIAERASALALQIPERLQAAYFELVLYPIRGAWLLNEYQLQGRLAQVYATQGRDAEAQASSALVNVRYDELNAWTRRYNEELLGGKWRNFFNWRPYHWYYSSAMDVPVCTQPMLEALHEAPAACSLSAAEALTDEGVSIVCEKKGSIKLWMKALTPVRNFSKAREDNIFCHVHCGRNDFDAAATPINNVWHSPWIGPMWSEVGTLLLEAGENRLHVTDVAPGTRIESLFIGQYPPLPNEPMLRVAASEYAAKCDGEWGQLSVVEQLGYRDGVTLLPFDTPSFEPATAPYVEYLVNVPEGATAIEVRTLPTLHIYEGRDARYAVQLDDAPVEYFSIHEGDFTSEWRLNVLRGYATRTVSLPTGIRGTHTLRIYFLDPGIVLQEIRVKMGSDSCTAWSHSEQVLYHSTADSLYRIPALASTNEGSLIAISDYRYSHGYDVGFGRPIDVLYRVSQDLGKTWSEPRKLADCHNEDYGRNIYGFGDACIVADRESPEVVVMCVGDSLAKSYPEHGKLEVYQFRSFDGGQTWTEVRNITSQFYDVNPAWESLFVASGRIFQSRVVKRGRYYRLYCAALVAGFGNAVFYSDDFGRQWHVLGDVLHSPCPEGDEAKTEELPDGTVILSSRTEGRYFNLFHYDNDSYDSGQWTEVQKADDILCEGNATNGEILAMKVRNSQTQVDEWLYLQSVPAGPGRSHVSIYYKVIPQQSDYRNLTAQDFGRGWKRFPITDLPSAYSTLCSLDASRLAIFYERLGEDVNGYEMVLGRMTGLVDAIFR